MTNLNFPEFMVEENFVVCTIWVNPKQMVVPFGGGAVCKASIEHPANQPSHFTNGIRHINLYLPPRHHLISFKIFMSALKNDK